MTIHLVRLFAVDPRRASEVFASPTSGSGHSPATTLL